MGGFICPMCDYSLLFSDAVLSFCLFLTSGLEMRWEGKKKKKTLHQQVVSPLIQALFLQKQKYEIYRNTFIQFNL